MTQSEKSDVVGKTEVPEAQIAAVWDAHAAEFEARIDDTSADLLALIDTWNSLMVGRAGLVGESIPEPDRYKELKACIQSFIETSPHSRG